MSDISAIEDLKHVTETVSSFIAAIYPTDVMDPYSYDEQNVFANDLPYSNGMNDVLNFNKSWDECNEFNEFDGQPTSATNSLYSDESVKSFPASLDTIAPQKHGLEQPSTPLRPRKKAKRAAHSRAQDPLTFDSDLFEDVALGENLADATTFDNDGDRDSILKNIIDDLPDDEKYRARRQKTEFVACCRAFGRGSVKPESGGVWKVPGIRTGLYSHQVVAAGRGIMIEKSTSGVLLADQMGLGKTIETLAVIAACRPPPHVKIRATLVICMPNTFRQWQQEIRDHCISIDSSKKGPGIGKYVFWRGKEPEKDTMNALEELNGADIILTTTSEVVDSFNQRKGDQKAQGLLHRAEFLRVCLDEAHVIRNDKCVVSNACRELHATRHWALTGTPLINRLSDLYAVLQFLKHPLASDKAIFKSSDPKDIAKMLLGPLSKCTIRRTYANKLFGKRLVDLPKMTHTYTTIQLSPLESKVYGIIHNRFGQYAKELMKNTGNDEAVMGNKDPKNSKNLGYRMYGLLLRPRQLVSHPMMLQRILVKVLEAEDLAKLRSISDPKKYSSPDDKTLAQSLWKALEDSGSGPFTSQSEADAGDPKCSKCKHTARDPQVSNCQHVYCKACVDSEMQGFAAAGYGFHCIVQDCQVAIFEYEDYAQYRTETGLGVARDIATSRHDQRVEGCIKSWVDKHGKIYRSSKVKELVRVTQAFLARDKKGKIVWFTQWLGFGKVLAKVCEEEKWKYVKYDGSMNPKAKDKAIDEFKNQDQKRVLIASLRAGGIGLNLTVASKVILLDHWWNSAIEQQAFARIYRIGQEAETELVTLVVDKTVEGHMMDIKNGKDSNIGGVITKLEMQEIWRPVRED